MLPEITLFGRVVPMYGVLAAAAAVCALAFVLLAAPRLGLDAENAVYLAAFGGVGALLGAKALYLGLMFPALWRELPLLLSAPKTFFAHWLSGGMVYYGGLFGALAGMRRAAGQYGVRLRAYLPVLVPAWALAHGIARVGCFCTGCCYGVENARFGLAFSASRVAPNGVRLLPVQLLEAAAELAIFGFLLWFVARPARRPAVLAAYLLVYAPVRFVLEFWRGDVVRGVWFGLSTSQWISLFLFLGVWAWLVRRKKQKT